MFSKTLFVRLKQAVNIVVLVGDEFNKTSKIPEFNKENIALTDYKPQEFTTQETYKDNVDARNNWYSWRQEMKKKSRPSLAHYSMVDLNHKLTGLTILNKSTDGLQSSSGIDTVVNLAGNLFEDICIDCNSISLDNTNSTCPTCKSGVLKPNIRWFGEGLNTEGKAKAASIVAECEVFIALGVSDLDDDISVFPFMAKGNGSYVVELSEKESCISSHCNESIRGDVNEILPKFAMLINQIM